MKRVKQIVMMAFASLLAQCVWAAVGDTITICNANKGSSRSAATFTGNTFTICIPASTTLPEGSTVAVTTITVGMNSRNDTANFAPYMKIGDTISNPCNGTGQINGNASVVFANNALKQAYGFTDKGLVLTVGTSYDLTFCSDAEGTVKDGTRWYCEQTQDPAFSVIKQSKDALTYRPTSEFVGVVQTVAGAVPDFVFKGGSGAGTLEGAKSWVSGLLQSGNEGSDVAGKMYGPNGIVNMAYDSENGNITGSKWHPWAGAASKNAFTIAAYLNVEAVKVAADTHAILISLGNNGGRKIVLAKEPDGSVALIAANGGTIQNASTMPKIAASKVAKGWHLYTFTFSTTDGLTLAVDGEDPIADSCDGAKVATATGFQIGSIYQGRPTAFKMPDFLGVAMVCGWTEVISAVDRAKLATEYPVQSSIKADVDLNTSGKILVLPSATSDGNHFIGVTNGALTIPADATVEVPHVRCLNSSSTDNRATVNIAGTVNVTSESSNPNVWADRNSYKGVLFGHWHGQGTYNVTGTLNAPNTYVEMSYTAEEQTLNVNGGTITTKGIYTANAYGTINLSNNGRIALSTSTFMNVPVTVTGGTIAAGETATYAKQLTVSSGELALEVGAGKTLTLNGGVTNNGTISVKTGAVVIPAGSEGTVAVTDGATLKLRVTDAQVATGYTASGVTLAEGQNITFILPDNTEETGSGNKLVAAAPTWTGDAGDDSWDNAANWSTGVVPTSDTAATIEKEASINVTSSSVCKQLIVGANVTLAGQIAANAMPNIVIANDKMLTINTTAASTINGISGGKLIKDGSATLSAKIGSGADTAPLHNMAVVIKNGKIMIDQPTGTEATIHDVAFTIEETACGEDKVPLDNYGWFSATGPWSIETTGHARVFNNNANNTSVIKGNGAFTKLGTGKVTILSSVGNSGNAYTGNVTVSAGELVLQPSGNGQTPNMTGTTTVNADATLTAKISSTAAANIKLASNGTFNVDQGSVNMTKASDQSVKGTVNIAHGATLANTSNDAIAYSGSTTVNVRGTLAMGTSRWTVGGSSTINLYGGCSVTGDGDGESVFDLYRSGEVIAVHKVEDKATVVEIAVIRIRNNQAEVNVEEGMTLKLTSKLDCNASEGSTFLKTGAGEMIASGTIANDVQIKLAAGTIQTATAVSVTTEVAGMMVVGDGSAATPYALATIVAKIGDTPYASVEDAIAHLGEGQTITLVDTTADLPAGWTTVTKDGVVTIRQKGDIYYVRGYMGTSEAALVVQAANGGTTSLLAGDTLVIGTPATVAAAWMANDFAIKTFKVEKDFTLHAGTVDAILDNATVTVAEGKTLTLNNSGSEKAITLGTVTLNGSVSIADATKATAITAAEINGTCTITLGENASITIGTKAETVTIASGVEHKHVVQNGTTYSLAMDQVTITVPAIDNTTVAVTGGTLADNAVVVDYGTAVTVTYTANENYKLVGGDGVYTFDGTADGTAGEGLSAVLDVVTITIPDAPANTVVKVTVGGTEVTVVDGSITATIGATVVVTYSAADGYIMDDVVTEFTASTTAPTITVPTEAPVQAVAKIGETLYPTLAAAFAVGGEVTLLQNTIETLTVAAGKTVTLDINGKVVKSQSNTITVKGTLVVNNTAEKGAIMSVASGKSAITTSGSGTFTINGGTIDAVGTAVSGVGTITGGTITSSGSFAVYANSSSGSIEITGGTITGVAAKGDVGVYSGNVKVTGATLANGIKFASNASGIILAGTDTTLFTPELGIYDGETLVGYAPAQTTGTISAMAGKTVKLLKDCTTTDYLTIGKSCTLDLNGHNLTTSAAAAIAVKGTSATPSVVTITGSGKVSSTAADCNAVQIGAYATVTIAGGEYVVPTDNAAVYIATSYAAKPSTVTITGGTFASGDGKYVLNIKGDQVARGAAISVTGGTFKDFDPSNCISEGAGTNFVADGYISIAEGANFVVAKKGAAVDPTPTTDGVAITIPVGGATVEVDGETTSTIPNTTGKHTVVIKDSTGKVIRADEVGVVNVEKTTVSTTHAVAVPFKGKTVATLLNTALLAEDDTLMAWIGGKYEVWKLSADKKWIAQTTYAQSGNHTAPDATTTALKCGQAVWVTTAGQIVTFGDVNATGDTVELEEGHNLLGNTSLEDATPTVAETEDQVQLIGEVDEEGNEIITRYNKTSTGWQSKIQKRTYIEAVKKWVTTEETSTKAPTVKPGRGYWLIRK